MIIYPLLLLLVLIVVAFFYGSSFGWVGGTWPRKTKFMVAILLAMLLAPIAGIVLSAKGACPESTIGKEQSWHCLRASIGATVLPQASTPK